MNKKPTIILISGAPGLNLLSVANNVSRMLPNDDYNVISSSDQRKVLQAIETEYGVHNPLLHASPSRINELGYTSTDGLIKQSELVQGAIQAAINRAAKKRENIIIAGSNVIPGKYDVDLDKVNLLHFITYTRDFDSALAGIQDEKLPYVDTLKEQQAYYLSLSERFNCVPIEYKHSLTTAYKITNTARRLKNPNINYNDIKPGEISITITGVTGVGKTTTTRALLRQLDNFGYAEATLTDYVRETARTVMDDDILSASSHELSKFAPLGEESPQLYGIRKQSKILEPILNSIRKRNKDHGVHSIIEGVSISPEVATQDHPYSLNVLLTVPKETLIERLAKRGNAIDMEKIKTVDDIMKLQEDLIGLGEQNNWFIVENTDLPELVAGKIITEMEAEMELVTKQKNDDAVGKCSEPKVQGISLRDKYRVPGYKAPINLEIKTLEGKGVRKQRTQDFGEK